MNVHIYAATVDAIIIMPESEALRTWDSDELESPELRTIPRDVLTRLARAYEELRIASGWLREKVLATDPGGELAARLREPTEYRELLHRGSLEEARVHLEMAHIEDVLFVEAEVDAGADDPLGVLVPMTEAEVAYSNRVAHEYFGAVIALNRSHVAAGGRDLLVEWNSLFGVGPLDDEQH